MIHEFHRTFKKRYKKIPLDIRRQFDERFRLFAKEPFYPILNNHALTGDRIGQWSINVTGDWRALYFFRDRNTIVFIDIDTYGNLYR